jgi:predicted RNA binding protein YcfA (HicA-like mRNA interferase family)
MSKRRLFSSDEVIKALLRCGFELHGKAPKNHQALIRPQPAGERHDYAIVPLGKKEIPKGTLDSILALANLGYEDFLDCAKIRVKGRKRKKPMA